MRAVDRLERARPRRRARHHRRVVPAGADRHQPADPDEVSRYRDQAKQAANAIWGSSAAHVRYKHITVVDDDIDIHDYAAVDWAIAIASTPARTTSSSCRSTFGAGLDPSTRKRDRNPALFGTGKWNRVLIDATMNLDYDPDPELGGARFPPTVWPDKGTSTRPCALERTRSRQAERRVTLKACDLEHYRGSSGGRVAVDTA